MNNGMAVFPPPRSARFGTPGRVKFTGIAVAGDARAPEIARRLVSPKHGVDGHADLKVECREASDDELERDRITGLRHDEGYRITANADGRRAALEYASERGLRYGLSTLQQLIDHDLWGPEVLIVDAPRFPVRGVIEGYYGPPWSPAERARLLELAARRRMNAYFYGPKDDAFHRERWRELYPPEVVGELEAAYALTIELGMDFWYTIGPGLTMSYASGEDRAALQAKLEQIVELGITRIGLLFDDIPPVLQHPTDRDRFATLADAHAELSNMLHAHLRETIPTLRLAVCPTVYHGSGTEAYVTRLGGRLDPRIDVFWTGPEICSRELTLRDAALLERVLSRPALYWDNYPVNDLEMAGQLHMGPYRGRDPHLYRASIGIVANGMERPNATSIPLLTIADYGWNPEGYDPEASWDDAIRTVVGAEDAPAFRVFADNNRYSALYPTDSPWLTERLHEIEFLRATERGVEANRALESVVVHLNDGIALFDRGMENASLEQEIAPWISKFRKGVELIEAYRLAQTEGDVERLRQARREFAADRTYVFADVLNSLL